MITYKTIPTIEGSYSVSSASIIFSTVLKVKRGGLGYQPIPVATAFTNGTVRVNTAHGILTFEYPFTTGEKIYVLIQI